MEDTLQITQSRAHLDRPQIWNLVQKKIILSKLRDIQTITSSQTLISKMAMAKVTSWQVSQTTPLIFLFSHLLRLKELSEGQMIKLRFKVAALVGSLILTKKVRTILAIQQSQGPVGRRERVKSRRWFGARIPTTRWMKYSLKIMQNAFLNGYRCS